MPAALPAADADERNLVADAIGVTPAQIGSLSREPLGRGIVAGFAVAADRPLTAFLDTSLLPVRAETGFVLEGRARAWIHPADPHLPALAPAAFGTAAAALLSRLGLRATADPEMVAYRPGRRAVLRITTADAVAWVKVVRPGRVERIVEIHRALGSAGIPVPAVRGWAPDGLVVLDTAVGTAAADGRWTAPNLLAAADELRDRLAVAAVPGRARTSLRARLPWYCGRLVELLPDRGTEIRGLRDDIDTAAEPAGEEATIHGDLHLGQIFLDHTATSVTGLVDVDTAGRGQSADDAAAFLAHAIASATMTTAGADRVWELAELVRERWVVDSSIQALTGVQLLGHALTAAEGGDAARAHVLLALARTVLDGKNPLTDSFGAA